MKKNILLFIFCVLFVSANSQNFLWTQHGGSTHEEQARAVCTTSNGDVLILCVHPAVLCNDSIDFDGGTGTYNLWGCSVFYIAKYTSAGQFLWAKTGTFSGFTSDSYTSVALQHYEIYSSPLSGAIYITGNVSTYQGMIIYKYDSLGNFLWQRYYGGGNTEHVWDMDFDSQDNIYSTGIFNGIIDFDPGAGVFNLNSSGNYLVYILKLDSAGNFKWAIKKDFLSAVSVSTQIYSDNIIYYTVNSSFNNLRLIKIDSLGNEHWNKVVVTNGVYSYCVSIALDSGANSYLTCNLQGGYSKIIKCDSSGNVVWNNFLPVANDLDVDVRKAIVHGQELYIAGDFETTIDFDPSIVYDTVTARNHDIFVAKYDTMGNYLGKGISGSGANERLFDMTINASGNIYICGTFQDSLDEDLGPAYTNIYLVGGPSMHPDFFVANISQTLFPSVTDFSAEENNLFLFPNPATRELRIQNSELKIEQIEIYNTLGEKVFKSQGSNLKAQSSVEVSQLPPGVYFVTVTGDKGNKITRRFIKL